MIEQGLPVPEGAILLTPFERGVIAAWQSEIDRLQREANKALGIIGAMAKVIGMRASGLDGEYNVSADLKFITRRE